MSSKLYSNAIGLLKVYVPVVKYKLETTLRTPNFKLNLFNRCMVDASNGIVKFRIKILIRIIGFQSFSEGSREARDQIVVLGEEGICFRPGVPTR